MQLSNAILIEVLTISHLRPAPNIGAASDSHVRLGRQQRRIGNYFRRVGIDASSHESTIENGLTINAYAPISFILRSRLHERTDFKNHAASCGF